MAGQPQGELNAVPLLNAVFCVDCENISDSPHEACTICGSRSLVSLFRMLGGTLRRQKAQLTEGHAKTVTYSLQLSAKVHAIPASELNGVIEGISRLTEMGADLENFHINVESVFDTQEESRAA